jgi:2-phosphosulfolactate phosphatase
VAVDVIRATTTAVTAAAVGRRCFPVPSLEAAFDLAGRLEEPLLAGEEDGNKPHGFDLQNSPAAIHAHPDAARPLVLLSTSGSRLMCAAGMRPAAYAACLRNHTAQSHVLADRHDEVMVLGAGTRGEFRAEDQLCCARIAAPLIDAGYHPADALTKEIVARWRNSPLDAFVGGPSTDYLRATRQDHDLEFILSRVDDVDAVFPIEGGEVVARSVQ